MPRSTNTRAEERVVSESLKSIPEKQSRILNEHIKGLKEENSELAKEIKALKEQLNLETQIKDVRKSSLDESSELLQKQKEKIEDIRGQRDALIFQMKKELQLGKITNEEYEKGMKLAYDLDDLEKSYLETRNELLGTYGKEQRAQALIYVNELKRKQELEDSQKVVIDHIKSLEKENELLDKNSDKYKKNVEAIREAKGTLNDLDRESIYDFAGKDYFSKATRRAFGSGFLGSTGAFIDLLMPSEDKAKDKKEKNEKNLLDLAKNIKNLNKNVEDIEDTEKAELKNDKETGETSKQTLGGFLSKFSGIFESSDIDASDVDGLGGMKGGKINKLNAAGLIVDVLDSKLGKLEQAVRTMASAVDSYANAGAQFLTSTKGILNASLYGYKERDNYTQFFKTANDNLGGSTLIKFEDYLGNIKSLATQGIGNGVEVAALLTTVAEKTVPQFSATSGYLRRLVLLKEREATQRFFGLESIIQHTLNKQFGESSYLNQLFESVNANLMDAMSNLSEKLGNDTQYKFLTSAQTWLGSLYEQGVDSNTVTRISNVINALGSGNISAVSSDAGMQKLMLLAMDKAGIDYATLLQKGFAEVNINNLLYNMVEYLQDIATTTMSNNVLESAYANMFGLSMTDMYAFRQLQKNIEMPNINGFSELEGETTNRLQMMSKSAYTPFAEKVNNLFDNVKFDFGVRLAKGNNYAAFKGGQFAYDIGKAVEEMPVIGTAGKVLKMLGTVSMAGGMLLPMLGVATDLAGSVLQIGNEENTVSTLYNQLVNNSSNSASTDLSSSSQENSSIKSISKESSTKFSGEDYQITNEMAEAELNKEDPMLVILKELEKSFMENNEGKMALAVSLQGMSNEVLKSFASIFADEESMTDIFGDKDTDKRRNNLFKYEADDETSSGEKSPNSNVYSTITSIS